MSGKIKSNDGINLNGRQGNAANVRTKHQQKEWILNTILRAGAVNISFIWLWCLNSHPNVVRGDHCNVAGCLCVWDLFKFMSRNRSMDFKQKSIWYTSHTYVLCHSVGWIHYTRFNSSFDFSFFWRIEQFYKTIFLFAFDLLRICLMIIWPLCVFSWHLFVLRANDPIQQQHQRKIKLGCEIATWARQMFDVRLNEEKERMNDRNEWKTSK